jgi:transaldolase/glucose-6-phosphate isomerase
MMTINSQSFSLPFLISRSVENFLQEWQVEDRVAHLWQGDRALWTSGDEDRWLGWLSIIDTQLSDLQRFQALRADIADSNFTHALLIGMGGSSICPEVLGAAFPVEDGMPDLVVLDSTDPSQVRACRNRVNLGKTLFIVSSKSGATLESRILMRYFLDLREQQVGPRAAGQEFIAITDPGSELERFATDHQFRMVFRGVPDIGGRFSALSDFGIVPATVMGIDVERLLGESQVMAAASGAEVEAPRNPAVGLGIVLGVAAASGRDKLTLIVSPGIAGMAAWLEQLLAESTGKGGKGFIPVVGEDLGPSKVYANDRVFIYLRLQTAPDTAQDTAIAAIEEDGHPVVRIELQDVYSLGQEFFRWELATAVAGSCLGLHPFDQPDVEASKIETRRLTARFESSGALDQRPTIFERDGISLYADERNHQELGRRTTLADYLGAHLDRLTEGDYFAILAYIEMNEENHDVLTEIRHAVRDSKRRATSVGFGPRFLHSTGQAYKGGPNSGVFLQITSADVDDLPVPGESFTFGVVKAAQANGDFHVLSERGRRVLGIHFNDLSLGLAVLRDTITRLLDS